MGGTRRLGHGELGNGDGKGIQEAEGGELRLFRCRAQFQRENRIGAGPNFY